MRVAIGLAVFLVAVAALVAWFGAYNVAADEPHWTVTQRALAALRARSIEARSGGIDMPDLRDEKRIAFGARQYAEMCEACHLAPGVAESELSRGLYPRPPQLARERVDPRRAFWVVKHGIKMSGMPAWGPTHGDDVLWSVVAFLQKLPELDAKRYAELARKPSHDGHTHRH